LICALALLSSACGTDTIIAVRGSSQTSPAETGGAASVPPLDAPDAPDAPAAPGRFHTEGSRIVDANGNTVRIRAVSWSGFETPAGLVQGLWARPLDDFLARIQKLGFDTLRLPFSNELIAGGLDPDPQAHTNPDLVGLNGIEMFTHVIERAGAHGLKVILVHSRSKAEYSRELWYTAEYPDTRFVEDWRLLAFKYAQNPHVFAFELHSDLRGRASWGDGVPETDWHAAAERAGDAILKLNPNVLIIVNGVQNVADTHYVRGGNLSGVRDTPIQLIEPRRLVYGAADYPYDALVAKDGIPGSGYPWLTDAAAFPSNLPAVWDAQWGYLVREGIAPVLLTSFGTLYESSTDKQWLDALVPYVKNLDLGFAYWTLNPGTEGTGGLLENDWDTVNSVKYQALTPLLR
jgi:endoglucanase